MAEATELEAAKLNRAKDKGDRDQANKKKKVVSKLAQEAAAETAKREADAEAAKKADAKATTDKAKAAK